MKNEYLDNFARLFIDTVRDYSIQNIDDIIQGKMNDELSKNIYKKLESLSENEFRLFLENFIPIIVDKSLFYALHLFHYNENIELCWKSDTKLVFLKEESDGFDGELFTEFGWIRKYSQERHKEYSSDEFNAIVDYFKID